MQKYVQALYGEMKGNSVYSRMRTSSLTDQVPVKDQSPEMQSISRQIGLLQSGCGITEYFWNGKHVLQHKDILKRKYYTLSLALEFCGANRVDDSDR